MTHIKKIRFAFIAANFVIWLPLVQSAQAEEVIWQTVSVQGEGKNPLCNNDTLFSSYAGNSASFVFTNMVVNLTGTDAHTAGGQFGGCKIKTRAIIPQGFYLSGISQSANQRKLALLNL